MFGVILCLFLLFISAIILYSAMNIKRGSDE
jgi:hypothetical protein